MKPKSIFLTGGAGYCGSLLTPQLLNLGYHVTVYDTLYFGKNFLPLEHPHLRVIEGDIRDIQKLKANILDADTFISLACISNDASFELNEKLSTSVNLNAFEPMVRAAKENGIQRFIYASSSSVYGVSDVADVTEDHPLVPVTLYNKYKGMCEPVLNSHGDDNFTVTSFRPATVCGYAPRLRLDLSVNILTNHAITHSEIKVFGGMQMRPNLHIQDYCDAIKLLIKAPRKTIHQNVFNVGFQNMTIKDLAIVVKKVVLEEFPEKNKIDIVTTHSDDIRSYHINSQKIYNTLGFRPKHTIEDAVRSLCAAFKEGKVQDSMENDNYYNIRTMQKLDLG
ncbi:SDR family oxidoreductase [Paracoccaceae bacterium]|nr:SDR family oxidoreductase [Paracoccaceae bacterium]